MTLEEAKALPTIGYWSLLGGVEVKKIEYDIEDYVVCIVGAWIGQSRLYRVPIKYTHSKDARPYIFVGHSKLYLDECLRTGH